jgi:hypothetical protein
MMVVLFAAGMVSWFLLNSFFSALVAAAGMALITFKRRVGPMASRLLFLCFFTLLWVPIGRLLEYAGLAVWALVAWLAVVGIVLIGGRRK